MEHFDRLYKEIMNSTALTDFKAIETDIKDKEIKNIFQKADADYLLSELKAASNTFKNYGNKN